MPIYRINEQSLDSVRKNSRFYLSMEKFRDVEINLCKINDTESEEYEQFLQDLHLIKSEFNKIEKESLDKLYNMRWDDNLSKSEMKKLMHLDSINYYHFDNNTRLFEIWYNGKGRNMSNKFFEGHSAILNISISKNSTVSKVEINIAG